MSNSLRTLMTKGVTPSLGRYLKNVARLDAIKKCVNLSNVESNIYKVVASFEDIDIIQTSDVPIGDAKIKLNYVLVEAIGHVTELLHENIALVSKAATDWSAHVNVENQQERLNAALDKLATPAKSNPIPEYSQLTEEQRIRVQNIFKDVLNQEEVPELNYLSDAIARYNAGASYTVLFKNLNLTLKTPNAIAVYEQEAYDTIVNQDTFAHISNCWLAFIRLNEKIAANPRLGPTGLRDLISSLGNKKYTNVLSDALCNIAFTKPIDEYDTNSKDNTVYHDVKQVLSNRQLIKPLSNDSWNRLKYLVSLFEKSSVDKVYSVVANETDLDNDDIYSSLSSYFELMEEMTVLLKAFMFITQTTVRNNAVIEDVIVAVELVTKTIDTLYTSCSESIVEDGEISQESIRLFINKILGRNSSKNILPELGEFEGGYNGVVNLANRHIDTANKLLSLKLRANMNVTDAQVVTFKNDYAPLVLELFGKDIKSMELETLFHFFTNDVFTTPLSTNALETASAEIYDVRSKLGAEVSRVMSDDNALRALYGNALGLDLNSYFDCANVAFSTFSEMVDGCSPSSNPDSNRQIIETAVTGRLMVGDHSYYVPSLKLNSYLSKVKLDTLPLDKMPIPDQRSTYDWGYGKLSKTGQHQLLELLTPRNKVPVTLNSIRDNTTLMTLCKHHDDLVHYFHQVEGFKASNITGLASVTATVDKLSSMASVVHKELDRNVSIPREDLPKYHNIVNVWLKDNTDALRELNLMCDFMEMLTLSVNGTLNGMYVTYHKFDAIASGFIKLIK